MTINDNNNLHKEQVNNNKQPRRLLRLSHLAHRWADMIELVRVAEPYELNRINFSGLVDIALDEQLGDEISLTHHLIKFSDYIEVNLYVVYYKPVVTKLINESQQFAQQVLPQAPSPALSTHSLFANQSHYNNDQPPM